MTYTEKEKHEVFKLASKIVHKFYKIDKSGRLLYLLVCKISAISKLQSYKVGNEYLFSVIRDDMR